MATVIMHAAVSVDGFIADENDDPGPMDVVPVVFGQGKRYFGPLDAQHLLDDPSDVIQGDRVLHRRYRVR